VTPDGAHVLVGIMGQDDVAVVDWRTRSVVKRIKTGKGSHNIFPGDRPDRALVSNRLADTISVIDLTNLTKIEDFAVPGGPDDLVYSVDKTEIWVTSRWRRQVVVLDAKTHQIKQTIRVGRSPHGIFVASD